MSDSTYGRAETPSELFKQTSYSEIAKEIEEKQNHFLREFYPPDQSEQNAGTIASTKMSSFAHQSSLPAQHPRQQQQYDHNSQTDDHEGDEDSDDSSVNTSFNRGQGGSLSARPPPKKRNRAALSCTLCRERKVKCDRVIPCQQCIKRGDTEFCHLDPNKRGPQSSAKTGKKQLHNHHQQHQQLPSADSHRVDDVGHPYMSSLPAASSAAEVDAIKARLAQLEQVLAQQRSGSETSPGFSAHSDLSPMGSASSRVPWNASGGAITTSPPTMSSYTDRYSSPHLASNRSPAGATSHNSPPKVPNFFSQQGLGDGIVGRLPPLGNAPSPNGGMGIGPFGFNSDRNRHRDGGSETNGLSSSFAMPSLSAFAKAEMPMKESYGDASTPGTAAHRGEVDSDTEDAALVLEGLAMGAGRGDCDGKKSKQDHVMHDIIEKPPQRSIQGYVEDDKTKDIMSEGRYKFKVTEDEVCPGVKAAQGELTKPAPGLGALAMECSAGAETTSAALSECKQLADLLKENPDAEFGLDGKRIPPAKRVCILLSQHENSLFNLVYGAETFLGWGMGWAFPAAEAAGDMMKVSEVVGCKGALQREAVLRAIIRSLPDRASADHLINIYESRVKFLAGNCIHMPTFKKEVAAFYDLGTVEKKARVVNFVDPGWLSLFLMILVLALHFHPCERPESVMHFFDGRTLHLWRSAAHTSLVLARYQQSSSIAVLQTIILINLHSMGMGKENFGLMHVAITNAIEMGLHRLGAKDKQAKPGENSGIAIRREMAKRIWHHFVFADWCSAGAFGGMYRIHPSQFNTPLPGNYNDSDLCVSPLPAPRPATEHTEMSSNLSQLQLAVVIRENVDMQNASELENNKLSCSDTAYLDGRYRGLLEQAPSFYRIGSNEGEGENTEVERWLFQQCVFHKLLRLHRPKLSSRASARTSCVLLARSILDMQRRIRSRCSVVDRLFLNLGQSFSAAIVLCLDLLQTPPSATMRSIVRGEVSEALKALRHVGASHHGTENNIRVIEALLEEEEVRWGQNGEKNDGTKRKRDGMSGQQQKKKNLLNLALRVAKAANGKEPFKPTTEGLDDAESESTDLAMNEATDAGAPTKDEQSRQLLEQLLMGRPTYDEPSSFSVGSFQNNAFNVPSNVLAPNGLDLSQSFASFSEDSNGQPFDLSRFLAECDSNSSPGSASSGQNDQGILSSGASDSGHSSLHGGRANSSSSSSRMSLGSRIGTGSEHHSPTNGFQASAPSSSGATTTLPASLPSTGLSPNAPEQSTGLDGFWNWVLTQGSIGASNVEEVSAPLGQLPSNVQPASQSQTQRPSYGHNITSQFQDLFARSLGTDRKGTSEDASAAVLPPPVSFPSPGTATTTTVANPSDGISSLGTPSAGIGSSWMSTPGLFEFAYEFGNDTAAASNAAFASSALTSQPPPTGQTTSWS